MISDCILIAYKLRMTAHYVFSYFNSTMKCFKWRTADRCKTGHPLRCSLKHRTITLEKEVSVTPDDQSATLFSPSFQNQSFYRNNNFCVYNISLDCPGKIVSLTSKLADYGLADAATCQDYLWFDTSFYGQSQKICGDAIRNFKDSVHTQSFIAILWTNENNSEGKFEVEARCTDQYIPTAEPEYSGSNPLLSNEQ